MATLAFDNESLTVGGALRRAVTLATRALALLGRWPGSDAALGSRWTLALVGEDAGVGGGGDGRGGERGLVEGKSKRGAGFL